MPQKKVCVGDYVIRIKCIETEIVKKPCPIFHRFNRETKAPSYTLPGCEVGCNDINDINQKIAKQCPNKCKDC